MSRRWGWLAAVLCLIAYYLFWVRGAIVEGFTHDDLMNLYRAESASWRSLWQDMLTIWRPSHLIRPMGELPYRILFDWFGFVPRPYHLFCITLGAVNALLIFFFMRSLLGSVLLALLPAWCLAYHGEMSGMYSNVGTIFDLLVELFYLSTLWMALWRPSSTAGHAIRLVLMTMCALAALDSKEMAVSLPIAVAGLFLLKHGQDKRAIAWNVCCIAFLVLMTIAFVFGRVLGEGGVSEVGSYRPSVSLGQFAGTFAEVLTKLFYVQVHVTPVAAMAVLIGPLVLFGVLRLRLAAFAWAMAVVSFLPLAFIPARGLDASYLPLFWMAVGFAAALQSLIYRSWAFRLSPIFVMMALTAGHAWIGPIRYPVFDVESKSIALAYQGISKALAGLAPDGRVAVVEDHFDPQFEWATKFIAILATRNQDLVLYRPKELAALNLTDLKFDRILRVTPKGVLVCSGPTGELQCSVP